MQQQFISSNGHNRTDLSKIGFFLVLPDKLSSGKIKVTAFYIRIFLKNHLKIHPGWSSSFGSKLKKLHTLPVNPNVLDTQSYHVTGLAMG